MQAKILLISICPLPTTHIMSGRFLIPCVVDRLLMVVNSVLAPYLITVSALLYLFDYLYGFNRR